ncbi:hypothetical protein VNO77_03677 [Canavalia gladiata]|uniref:Uncharacterized protein n=1 Tax=Canavalia gladiata TaxID=3824 RepID=A0AAN9R719_CANGL
MREIVVETDTEALGKSPRGSPVMRKSMPGGHEAVHTGNKRLSRSHSRLPSYSVFVLLPLSQPLGNPPLALPMSELPTLPSSQGSPSMSAKCVLVEAELLTVAMKEEHLASTTGEAKGGYPKGELKGGSDQGLVKRYKSQAKHGLVQSRIIEWNTTGHGGILEEEVCMAKPPRIFPSKGWHTKALLEPCKAHLGTSKEVPPRVISECGFLQHGPSIPFNCNLIPKTPHNCKLTPKLLIIAN